MRVGRLYILCLLIGVSFTAWATDINGSERYYEPLNKLSSNPILLSRNKEAPATQATQFPFSASEYATKMAKISGTWSVQTSIHLDRLTGIYSDRMFDALGVYSELHLKISDVFKKHQVSEKYQMLAPMLSGMNIHYTSGGGKRGVWQLDMITATRYGLIVNDIRDDRDDPIVAATAAAEYIKDLQGQFKSTEAVLWAYISSPAEVRRAFARAESSEPQDVLKFLPDYVKQAMPVFSAWNFIWTYTDKDNLPVFMPSVFQPYENAVTSGKTHLGQIAEVLEIPLSTLKELNPALKKQIAVNKETIHLPQGYAARFLSRAHEISRHRDSMYFQATRTRPELVSNTGGTSYNPSSSLNTTVKKYHKVKPGETLSQLAQKYNVSVSLLKKWNRLSSNGIVAGQKIIVQQSVQHSVSEKEDLLVRENVQIVDTTPEETKLETNTHKVETTVKTAPPKTQSAWIYYTVKSGDTLSSIGRKYGVTYAKIKEWNGLRSDNLSVGQKLKIKK